MPNFLLNGLVFLIFANFILEFVTLTRSIKSHAILNLKTVLLHYLGWCGCSFDKHFYKNISDKHLVKLLNNLKLINQKTLKVFKMYKGHFLVKLEYTSG